MRETINFNYDWQFSDNFFDNFTDEFCGQKIELPHTILITPLNGFDENQFLKISSYQKKFFLSREYANKILLLKFDGVAHFAEVFVNGVRAGEHKGGYTAFEIDISNFVKFDCINKVFVKVDSTERDDTPPFGGAIDYQCYGGIYREVRLIVVDKVYIENIYVKTPNALEKFKTVNVDVRLNKLAKNIKLDFWLIDKDTGKIKYESCLNKDGKNIQFNFEIDDVSLWQIDDPKIYRLVVKISGDCFDDKAEVNFGFRQACFTKNGFYLNGKYLKLVGLNRHQSYPYIGYAAPRLLQYDDAEFLKYTLGVNIARTSHYPQSQHFLDRCDEVGLLVFTEIPGWATIGDEKWQKIALQNTQEMIEQNFNHPSVVLWGVRINESNDNEKLYLATNKLAHSLDDSRQTAGVRCNKNSQFLEDVYTYNDFVHSGGNKGLERRHNIIRKKAPYLVSEHNGHMFSTKSFDNGPHRLSQAFRHLKVIDCVYKQRNICGAIGWCMADYNTHFEFGSGDKICYHGVADMFRIPKIASYAYISQQDNFAVLELADDTIMGDNTPMKPLKQYIFSNCDEILVFNNKKLIATLRPQRDIFKYLPHPPFALTNLIGDEMSDEFNFEKKDIPNLKNALVNFANEEPKLKDFVVALKTMLKYHLSSGALRDIGKSVCLRWRRLDNIRYEGYINGEKVVEKSFSPAFKISLSATTKSDSIIEKDTYEIFKIDVKAISETGQIMRYLDDVINISIDGVGQLIGDNSVALVGGVRGVYIRTMGVDGKIIATIKSNHIGECKVEVQVKSNGIS